MDTKFMRANDQKDKCPHCEQEFAFSVVLCAHKTIEHGEDPPHHCDICHTAFFSTQVYSVHLMNHCFEKKEEEKTEFLHCCICGLDYHSAHSLRIHLTSHAGVAFHRPKQNWPSTGGSNKQFYTCPYCQAFYKSHSDLQDHLATHDLHQGMPYRCDLCPMTFRLAAHLAVHKQRHRELKGLSKEAQAKYFQQIPLGGMLVNNSDGEASVSGRTAKTFIEPSTSS